MTSVQERLQLKRMALDKWSTREKLCLASAVACSGDQNWMSVSRSLKMLCGANRPADWFSQKSCAVQFGDLLENVETPKRKKRTASERDNQVAETPTESILRKLNQERINELKQDIQKEQEEYAKLRREILLVQNTSPDEAQLVEMWSQIEKEKELKDIEQQKHSLWLKEREERKLELQKAWRPTTLQSGQQPGSSTINVRPLQLNLKPKSEEMEEEESNTKQGTSPLLTSLLKSSSPASSSVGSVTHLLTPTTTNTRAAAPTITNLLTGNTQTQTILNATTSTPSYHHIQNQPLTGPIPVDQPSQIVQSPSQAAPTLSMLLENKNNQKPAPNSIISDETQKADPKTDDSNLNEVPMDIDDDNNLPNKDEDQHLIEVFNELIPDNIDELADILTNNNAILNPELLEEESILENVESLMDDQEDIDEQPSQEAVEQDQNVNTVSKNIADGGTSSKIKPEIKAEEEVIPQIIPDNETKALLTIDEKKPVLVIDSSEVEDSKPSPKIEDQQELKLEAQHVSKTETSEDSDKNTCLQSLKFQIKDEHTTFEETIEIKDESLVESEKGVEVIDEKQKVEVTDDEPKTETIEIEEEPKTETSERDVDPEIIEIKDDETNDSPACVVLNENELSPKKSTSEECMTSAGGHDFANPKSANDITEKSEDDKQPEEDKEIIEDKIFEVSTSIIRDQNSQTNISQIVESSNTITIIDTDDDSPIEVIKEDKIGKTKRDYSRKKPEFSSEKKQDDTSDDNRSNLSIRKLKERDRSESPLVDDENADSIPRTRRRYSSTPIIDSIPNSPASSDDREYKAWKKSILMVYNRLNTHKYASIFLRPTMEESAPNYKNIVFRPMDLQTIKKNIESGAIRNTTEFQRDVLLMFQNAIMYYKKDNNYYNMAREMMADSILIIENMIEGLKKDAERQTSLNSAIKSRSRKSHRLP